MTKNHKRFFHSSIQVSSNLCQQSALELSTAKQNSQISNPINYLPQTINQQEQLKSTEQILQAVLIEDEPPKQKNPTRIERILSPYAIGAAILFIAGSIILAETIFKNQTITEIEPVAEEIATQIPNLAAEELIQLDLQTIVTLKPLSKAPEPIENIESIKIKIIPGAYSDLATALLPSSLRPYLYKSHILEPIPASELPAEAKLR